MVGSGNNQKEKQSPGNGGSAPVGAVLVCGGGIAGIQASLDLSAAGFRVHLAESAPSIGGAMSKLDKTFPTGDCATCILSPKLVQCARDINIDLHTLTEIEAIRGQAGRFTVTLRRRPRFVVEKECNGCGDCIRACPVELTGLLDCRIGRHKAIDRPSAQAVPNVVTIEKQQRPPCQMACPLGQNAQGYIALIRAGKYREAIELIRETNPFPSICGYVCHHPCEAACDRGRYDDPIAIRALKRFAVEKAAEIGWTPVPVEIERRPERVAIVGAGPAGLAAANRLAREGYGVTVFEASEVLGGMLRLGIPEFRLPRRIIDAEIEAIRSLGVEIRTGMKLGEHITIESLFAEDYRAVFIATGAYMGNRMGIEGEKLEGVHVGLDFVRRANLSEKVSVGKRVAVIGGGNAAVDVARVAKRLGAGEVTILYRRTRHEMPADPLEVADAMYEGVRVCFLTQPARIVGNAGRAAGVECVRMRLSDEKDSSGRRRPVPIEGSEHVLPFDAVLIAIGQTPNTKFAEHGSVRVSKWSTIEVDPETMQTSRPGVFAGGDVVVGAGTLVEAIAAGQRAAATMLRYIAGETLPEPDLKTGVAGPKRPQWNEQDRARFERMLADGGVAAAPRATLTELGYDETLAQREAARCLNCGLCAECMECVRACKRNAVAHNQQEERFDVEVGAIILAPGYDAFDAKIKGEFGFGHYPNVITGLQFERMLSASGPTLGALRRPSDAARPRRIAFIQCVGSRDTTCDNDYCSAVCCMASTKQAILVKEHEPETDVTIFYIDLRAFGKDFDRYCDRARKLGVRYVRAIPSRLMQMPDTRDLRLAYIGVGQVGNLSHTNDAARQVTNPSYAKRVEEEFGLVVLSSGLEPSARLLEQAGRLGIRLNEWAFAATDRLSPVRTSVAGIFVAGAFEEPKDIPDSVVQASGAAAEAMALLARARGSLLRTKVYPPQRDVKGEPPRVGVFVCHCGSNIAAVVDVEKVTERLRAMPHVAYAEHTMYACADDSQAHLREMIAEHRLNRVVVASCTPRTHEPIFRDTLREAGLNPCLLEMANIRDQCSWVHADDRDGANRKAADLVRMAVARAAQLSPLQEDSIAVRPGALVVGGGLAGLTAALSLAEQGFGVHLVEKSDRLGGTLNDIHSQLEGGDIQTFLRDLIARVQNEPLITLHCQTTVAKVTGFVGNFTSELKRNGGAGCQPVGGEGGAGCQPVRPTEKIEHGVLIVATGATEHKPTSFGYGKSPRVVTQLELDGRLARGELDLPEKPTIAMIQCVEQRCAERPYCSRVCCATAVKNALALRLRYPKSRIAVFYRDMRTYGFREKYYKQAREQGVLFVLYDQDRPPEVTVLNDGRLHIEALDPSVGRPLGLDADLLALSVPMSPRADREELSTLLRVPLNADGFFLEAHMKLRPVDFASEGIFLCGTAHAPKFINETIAQAKAATARAASVLSRKRMPVGGQISWVDPDKCVGCMTCYSICPYMAPRVGADNKAEVQPAICMGCGICAAECPAMAIQLRHYTNEQVLASVEELLNVRAEERAAVAGEDSGEGVAPIRWTRRAIGSSSEENVGQVANLSHEAG
jgi:heterodisulfide reductase subunit A-like polyferredoxin